MFADDIALFNSNSESHIKDANAGLTAYSMLNSFTNKILFRKGNIPKSTKYSMINSHSNLTPSALHLSTFFICRGQDSIKFRAAKLLFPSNYYLYLCCKRNFKKNFTSVL